MRHIWTILCQITSEDKQSDAFSLISVIDNIQITADPNKVDVDDYVVPINYHLVSMWWCEESEQSDEVQVQVRLFSPEEEDIGGLILPISSTESSYSRLNVKIQGFPYKGNGVYKYIVSQILQDVPIEVQQIPVKVEWIPTPVSQD